MTFEEDLVQRPLARRSISIRRQTSEVFLAPSHRLHDYRIPWSSITPNNFGEFGEEFGEWRETFGPFPTRRRWWHSQTVPRYQLQRQFPAFSTPNAPETFNLGRREINMIRSVITIHPQECNQHQWDSGAATWPRNQAHTNTAMIIALLHLQQNNMRSNQVHPRLLESFEKSYFGCQLCTVKALLEYPNVTWRQGFPC